MTSIQRSSKVFRLAALCSAIALSFASAACSSSSDDTAGGAAGSAGASAGGGGSGAGGAGAVSSGGSAGTTAGGSAAGGSASGGSAAGGSASGGSAGATAEWFRDDFDTELPAWAFDEGDPAASYVYDAGDLVITGGSLQGFAWLPLDPAWGSDYQVEITFRIETGMVGGVVARAQDVSLVNALNCNLREDLDQLRAARHSDRTYLTIGSRDTPVELGTRYTISARVSGGTLTCSQQGGPSFAQQNIATAATHVGLFVYRGTVRFESFVVRP